MTPKEIQERNKEIALMLGANVQDTLERIYIDKMVDDELTFHNMSVNLNTYEWNGTTNIHYIPFNMLQFHSDWNWLMEAVEFIQKELIKNDDEFCIEFYKNLFGKPITFVSYINKNVESEDPKEAVFIAVSDFAKKFNNSDEEIKEGDLVLSNEGAKWQAERTYSEEDMIAFAEFIATYPDKNRNVNGQMLHSKSKYDCSERTIDLLQEWIKEIKNK